MWKLGSDICQLLYGCLKERYRATMTTEDDDDDNNDIATTMNFKNRRNVSALVIVQTDDNESEYRPNSVVRPWNTDPTVSSDRGIQTLQCRQTGEYRPNSVVRPWNTDPTVSSDRGRDHHDHHK